MRQWLPLYEGDGYLHLRGPHAAVRGEMDTRSEQGLAQAERKQESPATTPGNAPARAQQLRADALRAWFPKAAAWARDRIRYARMCEAERYLAEATDLADLEHRLQEAARKGMTFNQD